MEPTHTDISLALRDLHQWVLDHPGALVISADEGVQLGFSAYTEPVETEQSFFVRIPLRDAKKSLEGLPDSRLKRNLRYLLSGPGPRGTLASLLACSNGWSQLVMGDVDRLYETKTPQVVYVDVDDTLVWQAGSKRIPRGTVIEHVRKLHQEGATLYCWSTAGGPYARSTAQELGIAQLFVDFLPKPNLILDDQPPSEWHQTDYRHPNSV